MQQFVDGSPGESGSSGNPPRAGRASSGRSARPAVRAGDGFLMESSTLPREGFRGPAIIRPAVQRAMAHCTANSQISVRADPHAVTPIAAGRDIDSAATAPAATAAATNHNAATATATYTSPAAAAATATTSAARKGRRAGCADHQRRRADDADAIDAGQYQRGQGTR